jgi:hypothetical protein
MLVLITFLFALQTYPNAMPSSTPAIIGTPAGTENPAMTQLAREQFDAFASGKIDKSQYSVDIPQSAIEQAQKALSSLGPVQSVQFMGSAPLSAGTGYAYRFVCEKGTVIERFSIKDGKINAIYFAPPVG